MQMLGYLIHSSLCLTVFYFVYVALFSRMTFFKGNRIYLLGSMIISFIVPLSNFSFVEIDYHAASQGLISTVLSQTVAITTKKIITSSSNNVHILVIVYWVGFVFIIGRLLVSIVRILRLKRGATISFFKRTKIIFADIAQPFSFFNIVFLPKPGVNRWVIDHEMAHVRQLHWIDLMLVEIVTAILWFNPIMTFYKRSLKMQHEYEADAAVLKTGAPLEQYLNCLIQHLQSGSSLHPISQFLSPSIKHRIFMMTKMKTSSQRSLLYITAIPVVCFLLLAFSTPTFRMMDVTSQAITKSGNLIIVVDAAHGGHDPGAQHGGGLSEKDITLSIAKAVQKAGAAHNVQVVLTRTSDEAFALEERVKMISRYQADAFISLHTNNSPENITMAGVTCVVSEQNAQFDESIRLAQSVLQQFQDFDGLGVNGIKTFNPYIIRSNKIPSILLEVGFLSNENDNSFLADQGNHETISKKIIDAVVQFKK